MSLFKATSAQLARLCATALLLQEALTMKKSSSYQDAVSAASFSVAVVGLQLEVYFLLYHQANGVHLETSSTLAQACI